jgi:uncharacterized protein (DUF2164 family)
LEFEPSSKGHFLALQLNFLDWLIDFAEPWKAQAIRIGRTMKKVEFSKEDKAALISRILDYFDSELDQPIGLLKAELVLDFFAKEVGGAYYDQGLRDAHAAVLRRVDDLADDIYQLEREDKA